MKIYNIEQWTDEWFAIRKLKMTASHWQEIGNCGKWLDTYTHNLMAEYYSSWEREKYTNPHIERWNELENQARQMYEFENWVTVDQVWFIEYNEYVGCSPDWLIWEDWGIEIKCQDDKKHFAMILDGKIDSKYIRQIQMNLLITGRKWRDFVSYNPNYIQWLIVSRIEPNEEMFEKLKEWFKKWEEIIKGIKSKLANPVREEQENERRKEAREERNWK